MGMYTEFGVDAELNAEGAGAIGLAIAVQIWPTDTPRAEQIWQQARLDGVRLRLRLEVKNYDGDIEEAVAWIRHYLAAGVPPEQVIAGSWCEANLLPVLYTAGGE